MLNNIDEQSIASAWRERGLHVARNCCHALVGFLTNLLGSAPILKLDSASARTSASFARRRDDQPHPKTTNDEVPSVTAAASL